VLLGQVAETARMTRTEPTERLEGNRLSGELQQMEARLVLEELQQGALLAMASHKAAGYLVMVLQICLVALEPWRAALLELAARYFHLEEVEPAESTHQTQSPQTAATAEVSGRQTSQMLSLLQQTLHRRSMALGRDLFRGELAVLQRAPVLRLLR
jgi:hypothetical protein